MEQRMEIVTPTIKPGKTVFRPFRIKPVKPSEPSRRLPELTNAELTRIFDQTQQKVFD
jgi:hypothetical protein